MLCQAPMTHLLQMCVGPRCFCKWLVLNRKSQLINCWKPEGNQCKAISWTAGLENKDQRTLKKYGVVWSSYQYGQYSVTSAAPYLRDIPSYPWVFPVKLWLNETFWEFKVFRGNVGNQRWPREQQDCLSQSDRVQSILGNPTLGIHKHCLNSRCIL